MSYTFDNQPMGTPLTGNIATQFFGGSNFAYVGFGAGTGGLSNIQSVRNINITATTEGGQAPGNHPPVAVADTATTSAGTAVNIAVLANDSDPDNNPLTVTAVSNLVNGTATINANNTITYTPTPGFTGSGGFTYSVSDGTATSTAPVSVTVTAVTPPPAIALTPHGSASVANGVYTLTTTSGQAGTAMSTSRIDVRQNFTVGFDVNLGASDAGADGAAIVFHNDPRGVNAIGTIGGGLGIAGIQNGLGIEFDTYNNNAAGQSGPDIAADHTGFRGTDTAFATTPVALPNIEDGAWHHVVVSWNAATQTMSYTFDNQPMGTPLTGNIATQFFGGSNFAYVGFGAGTGGLSNIQSVRNINITATTEGGQAPGNRPPVAVADTATTSAGTAVNIAVLANDSDPDNNPLTVTAVSNLVNGTATINANNTITYTPTPGFTGSGGFTYSVSDGTATSTAPVSVTVTAVTPPPAIALTPHGSASVANGVYTLTTTSGQAGTAMSTSRIDVRQNFTVGFDVNLGASDAGADGAAIVFHNDPRGVPTPSAPSAAAWGSPVSRTGSAIEFDTYNNNAAGQPARHRRRPHRFPRHRHRLRDHAGGAAQHRGRRVASRRGLLECGHPDDELHLR